ncbi:SIR2 family protein [Nannocystis pusilla]|uniref:SIR2 family protein n=1 Tax=Nannocystis pusilla TaxID=889268 RepID=A0ABS7TXH2_9BACT|nr:SIR2 family protein [Nannocystis pusilla]MBZ5712965.1 SIR2 family protein [Nannocystis pusilla]
MPPDSAGRMALEFASDEDLLDRLSARPHELVYLVGSAITAPSRGDEPGVPRVEGVIALIRGEYQRASELQRFEAALEKEPDNRYQAAFRHLLRTRDQDVANAVIRRAVLQARRASPQFPGPPADSDDHEQWRALEDDVDGWHLPPAADALGQVLARAPATARPLVLTSNFDPLVSISVRRAGGRAYMAALHGDGSLSGVDGQGCLVVHFHGHWFRTDTLHTPSQLGQDRPKLSASLSQLISSRTLVVLGYSGWDDVFTRSLIATIRGGLPIKIAWAFYPGDEAVIQRESGRLLEALRPGIEIGRVMLYKGIDAHVFLPRLAERLAESSAPASGAHLAGDSGPRPGDSGAGSGASGAHHAGDSGSRPGASGQFFAGESGLRPIVPPADPDAASSHTAGPIADVLGTHAEAACAPGHVDQGMPSETGSHGHVASSMSSGTNPFQKAGMLGLAVPSYVERAADAGLAEALEDGAQIVVVRGDFSIGKSSLLLRADRAWRSGTGAAVCRLDLQMMRVDDVNLYFDEFFAEAGRAYGQSFKGWREIQAAAAQRPLLLTLDEFGGLTPEVAQRFVPALYRVVTQLAGSMRVVVTTRDPIAEVLASFELSNPNLGEWPEVELRPFTEAELGRLLALLSPRARAVVERERAVVHERTKMLPKPAQCLCFNLWKDEAAGASDADLALRVRKKESYR